MFRWPPLVYVLAAWTAPLLVACGDASPDGTAPVADCSLFPQELLDAFGLQRQLVLNLAGAGGTNYASVRDSFGLPDPATFRDMADAFEAFDTSGIEELSVFDTPAEIIDDLHTTADLLQSALAAAEDTSDPAWAALSAFYTQDFYVQHNASISWYLSEADCV